MTSCDVLLGTKDMTMVVMNSSPTLMVVIVYVNTITSCGCYWFPFDF